mmetsp:Transcript_42340/g.108971  ORF Transcript_42340/g.108971 Transcript_42340/m.108971 type:complete len:86 (+) Transcript_42340:173-430(+)
MDKGKEAWINAFRIGDCYPAGQLGNHQPPFVWQIQHTASSCKSSFPMRNVEVFALTTDLLSAVQDVGIWRRRRERGVFGCSVLWG